MEMELNSKNIKRILLIVFLSAVIVAAVFNFSGFWAIISKFLSFVSPIISALCIAFVLNVFLTFLEEKVFKFMSKSKFNIIKKLKRPICLTITYVFALGVISLLVLFIIPDIIDTFIFLADKLPSLVVRLREWVLEKANHFNIPTDQIPFINFDLTYFANTIKNMLSSYSTKIVGDAVSITSSVVNGVFNTLFSIVISVYILAQKEKIGKFTKKIIDSFIPQKACEIIYHVSSQAYYSFSRFIGGQLTESLILGILCYIGMLIFRFPNAPIISVLIAVTSLVPIVGAFTGVLIGFFLIVITNPIKALLFVLFVIILQQIEGNLIYPRVVGKAVGLPGVIVISAVLIGGNIGGVIYSLIAVPVAAVIYVLLKEAITYCNNQKKLPEETPK